MNCYKVTDKDGWSTSVTRSMGVCYEVGKFTEAPKGTGLLVFFDLGSAKAFASAKIFAHESARIWICECEQEITLPLYRLASVGMFDTVRVLALWRGNTIEADDAFSVWPRGTRAYQRVKILEELPVAASEQLHDEMEDRSTIKCTQPRK